MHGNYHFMKTLTNERINERLVEAEAHRLGRTGMESKLWQFSFSPLRDLLAVAIAFIRKHPTPVIHWEFGWLRRYCDEVVKLQMRSERFEVWQENC